MKVLLIGATGKVGAPILTELLFRGHDVVALVRTASAVPAGATAIAGDVFVDGLVESAAEGCAVIVSSVALRDDAQRGRTPVELTRRLASAAVALGCRWISLGGAGSLEVAPGVQLVDTPEFPAVAHAESAGFREALEHLRTDAPAALEWTVVSPPSQILIDAARTGTYRTSADTLIRDTAGLSSISVADLAVAVVDEVESSRHPRTRFAVGY
jgi:putative NADH-flavin reductase